MKFRTEFKSIPSERKLDPCKPVTLIGSCFSGNIGTRMRRSGWDVYINPCGVLYNPYSIGQTVINALLPEEEQRDIIERSAICRDDMWLSWLFDSSVVSDSKEGLIEAGLSAYAEMNRALLKSQTLIVTLGTAYYYRLADGGQEVVANCHKMPSATFTRHRMSVAELTEWAESVHARVGERLQHLRVIHTVSPVRHLADGFVENTRSKATLLLGCEEMEESELKREYFPAYEILNDDLRSYRFYAKDLAHPSEEAIDYIWEKFQETFLDRDGREFLKRGAALQARLNHRPLIPGSRADIEFRAETDRLLREFLGQKSE